MHLMSQQDRAKNNGRHPRDRRMSAARSVFGMWMLASLLLLAACGGNSSNNSGTNPAPVVSLAITPTTAQVESGDSVALQVTAQNTTIVWPTTVAGLFTTSGNTATYTPPAEAGRYEFIVAASANPAITATATIEVRSAPDPVIISLSITPTTAQILSGGSVTLQVAAENTEIIWPESVEGSYTRDGNIVTYTPPAVPGFYHFTVTTGGESPLTATAQVEVQAPAPVVALSIAPTAAQVESGDSVTLQVTAANTDVVWPTSVPGSFTHSGNTVTYTPPAAAGHYQFTVTASADPDITATATVEVFVPAEARITSFNLPPLGDGAINQATGVISFTSTEWIEGLDALSATFTASGTVTVGGVTQVSGITANNFYRDLTYTVATGSSTQRAYTVRIKSPQTTGLPVIRIDTQGGVDISSKEDYLQTNITVVDPANPAHSFTRTEYRDQVRGRGNTTWGYPKKPYRVRFQNRTSLFGLVEARNWVLLANYQDPTLMMNIIAFELGQRFGLPFPHHYVPVDLFLNGKYVGNYLLTEHNQTGAGRVDIDENDGFFVELDTYFDEEPRFYSNIYSLPVMIKTPEDLEPEGYDFVKNSINGLTSAMNAVSFPDNGYRDLIDMSTFVDFILINEMVRNDEIGWPKSTYMYKDSDARNGKISMGPLWDFDWAFGYTCTGFQYFGSADQPSAKHPFFQRLFQDPTFVTQYKARWEAMRVQVQSMSTFIRNQADALQRSQEENFRVWAGTQNNGHAREIDDLVDWWEQRFDFLDQHIRTQDLLTHPVIPYCH